MTWLFIRFDCLEIKTWFAKTTLKVAIKMKAELVNSVFTFIQQVQDQFKLMLGVEKCWTKSVANEVSKVKSI